jgi:hypothetical protein
MTTDTARAIEHLTEALRSLEFAQNYLGGQRGAVERIDEMRTELNRLMHELEGEE